MFLFIRIILLAYIKSNQSKIEYEGDNNVRYT